MHKEFAVTEFEIMARHLPGEIEGKYTNLKRKSYIFRASNPGRSARSYTD
jgi:hypothetical protein